MGTHNLCFNSAEIWRISDLLSENFLFLLVKFSVYLNRHVFVNGILSAMVLLCFATFFFGKIHIAWHFILGGISVGNDKILSETFCLFIYMPCSKVFIKLKA